MIGKVICRDCHLKYAVEQKDVRLRDGSYEQWVTCPFCKFDQEVNFKLQPETLPPAQT